MSPRNRSFHPASRLLIYFLLCLLFSVVLSLGWSVPAAASLPAEQETQNQQLSTPQLIEQAYAKGEMTGEERLLYYAYAIYEYPSLPLQYRSQVPWSGTIAVQEIRQFLSAAETGDTQLSPALQAEFDRLLSPEAATVCDVEDRPNSTESAHFHLNHGSIGGGLTAADYLTALETAYTLEVTSYGWSAPPYCASGLGTCINSNPWSRYPVQTATDLQGGIVGYVTYSAPGYPAGSYTGQVNDNPNTTVTETAAIASCMVVREDYSTLGDARAYLERNMSHEFTHSIQRGTGDPSPEEDGMWYESSARYMQDEVFDDNNQLYHSLWPVFSTCLGQYSDDPYGNWLPFRYSAEHNGGTNSAGGGEDIMQAYWANIAAGQSGLAAYNNALGVKGTNLRDTYHDYAIASRFLKTCPTASPYCYEEAEGYRSAAGRNSNHGDISSIGGNYTGNLQDNFAINWVGLPKRGIYSIRLENTSGGGQFRVSIVADTGSGLQVTPFPQVVGGNQKVMIEEYRPPNGAQSVVAVITNQQQTADDPTSCSSNPYRLSTAPPVSFVIDDTGSMGEEINYVKTTVNQKVDEFAANGTFPKYHLLTFKDDVNYRGATVVTQTIKSWVNALYATGGGDCPEEMLGALNRIAQEAPYSEAWVMTDAGFHGSAGDLATTIFRLIQAHVTVHPIIYSWCFSSSPAGMTGQDSATSDVSQHVPSVVGPESFGEIAKQTGGHYFHIASGDTQAATSILLNEMISTSDLVEYVDQVVGGAPIVYEISVDATADEVNVLLNVLDGNASLTLFKPDGTPVNPTDPGVTYTGLTNAEYYQIESPVVGLWQAHVSGDGEFTLSASGSTAVSFEYYGDTSLPLNEPAQFLALLTGPVETADFQLAELDGTLVTTIPMYDDGAHGDGEPGDLVYGGEYTPTETGSFYFRVQGTTSDGSSFERIATEIIRIQTLSVVAPTGQTVLPGATVQYQFSITNSGPTDDTFDLTVTSSQGWANVSAVPASLVIASEETVDVIVPVDVPLDATSGTVDETVLAAVSRTSPGINDAASVLTTVGLQSILACNGTPEAFEAGVPPTGWSVVSNQPTSPQWTTIANCGEAGNYTGGAGEAACAYIGALGTTEFDTELRTPVFNLAGVGESHLTYRVNFQAWVGIDMLDLDLSTDAGATWTTILRWDESHGAFQSTPGENVVVDLTPWIGQANMMLRWRYHGPGTSDWGYYAQVDDVRLNCSGVPTAVTLSGLAASENLPVTMPAPVPLAALPAAAGVALGVAAWLRRKR